MSASHNFGLGNKRSHSPEPPSPLPSVRSLEHARSPSRTTQLAREAFDQEQQLPVELEASRVRYQSPLSALENAIAAIPGGATFFTLPSPHDVGNKSREELQNSLAKIPRHVDTIRMGRAFSARSFSLPWVLSALPQHIEEIDLRECSLWLSTDTASLLSILKALPAHIKKLIMGSSGFANIPLPDLEAICDAIPTHLLLFDISTPLLDFPSFSECADTNEPLFDLSGTLFSRTPTFVLARIFARLSPHFTVLDLRRTHIGSRRMGELVHIFGSISRGVVYVDSTFFYGKSSAELQLLSRSLAIKGATFTWRGCQMLPQKAPSPLAAPLSYDDCLQKCRSYSSPIRAKTDAVNKLQGLLERCRAGEIASEQVVMHLLCALRMSNNSIFKASQFRTSTVKALFEECLLLMRSLREGLPDPFILEGNGKSYFISSFYEIYDPDRDACGYAIEGGLCQEEGKLRAAVLFRSHTGPASSVFANQEALFSHFSIPLLMQRHAEKSLQEFTQSLESTS